MQNQLFFICPTDHLENVVNQNFQSKNYFCTSLGNSMNFDVCIAGQIKELIITKEIQKISFILSSDNRIVIEATEKQGSSMVPGINEVYRQIKQQKKYSETLWKSRNLQPLILTYFLRKKIHDLKLALNSLLIEIEINGKIYNKTKRSFEDIHSDLICFESYHLN